MRVRRRKARTARRKRARQSTGPTEVHPSSGTGRTNAVGGSFHSRGGMGAATSRSTDTSARDRSSGAGGGSAAPAATAWRGYTASTKGRGGWVSAARTAFRTSGVVPRVQSNAPTPVGTAKRRRVGPSPLPVDDRVATNGSQAQDSGGRLGRIAAYHRAAAAYSSAAAPSPHQPNGNPAGGNRHEAGTPGAFTEPPVGVSLLSSLRGSGSGRRRAVPVVDDAQLVTSTDAPRHGAGVLAGTGVAVGGSQPSASSKWAQFM